MKIEEGIRWKRIDDARVQALGEGATVRVPVGKRAIRFARKDGRLFAVADLCPHQGSSFEGAWFDEGQLVCPRHRFHFDPATGKARHGVCSNLEVFPLEERPTGIHIGIPYTTINVFGLRLW